MAGTSLIYKNILIYRAVMNVLYAGRYRERFAPIVNHIHQTKVQSVLELCFGDVMIADYCRRNGIQWTGIDLNHSFVALAQRNHFNAIEGDITQGTVFPEADLCIMAGSLYHFHLQIGTVFRKVFRACPRFLVSEPVKNLSCSGGLLGYVSRRSANAGKGNEAFRYNPTSLQKMLDANRELFSFEYDVLGQGKKDMLILLTQSPLNGSRNLCQP